MDGMTKRHWVDVMWGEFQQILFIQQIVKNTHSIKKLGIVYGWNVKIHWTDIKWGDF